jgi:hypothetical protein
VGSTCQRQFHSPRALSLSLSLPSGSGLSAPVALVPLAPSASRARLVSASNHYPLRARSLSFAVPCDRPVSSAFPAPAVDQNTRTCARTPRSPATSPAHAPQLIFEHLPHPHSLPCLISHSLAFPRALPTPFDLAGDRRPPCQSFIPPEAMPGHPELCPEVRHMFPCLVFPMVLRCWPISASPEVGRGGRCTCAVAGQIGPGQCPALAPGVPISLLKIVQALASLRPPPHGRNPSPELPRPARSPPSAVLPSLTPVSRPQPY